MTRLIHTLCLRRCLFRHEAGKAARPVTGHKRGVYAQEAVCLGRRFGWSTWASCRKACWECSRENGGTSGAGAMQAGCYSVSQSFWCGDGESVQERGCCKCAASDGICRPLASRVLPLPLFKDQKGCGNDQGKSGNVIPAQRFSQKQR